MDNHADKDVPASTGFEAEARIAALEAQLAEADERSQRTRAAYDAAKGERDAAYATARPTVGEAAKVLLPLIGEKHRVYMTGKGYNPADYISQYSTAAAVIEEIAQEDQQ